MNMSKRYMKMKENCIRNIPPMILFIKNLMLEVLDLSGV